MKKKFGLYPFLILLYLFCSPAFAIAQQVHDPLEDFNRHIFWFNEQADHYVFEPVSTGYTKVVPSGVRRSVGNFFSNLSYPIRLVSDLVQLKFEQAGTHTGRFLINSTIGVAGLFDPAKSFGLEPHTEDFGSALGYWGVGEGPYLVLPFLGPSNSRDFVGSAVDYFLHPFVWIGLDSSYHHDVDNVIYGATAVDVVDLRASLQSAIDAGKEASTDYYSFVRGAYHQRRQGIIYDGNAPEADPFQDDEYDDYDDDDGDEDGALEERSGLFDTSQH